MSRAKSYIQIEGVFAREVLGSFNIIRGFATLQELATISAPVFMREVPGGIVEGHQRPLDQGHAEEIKRYFEVGDRRFIPEIILSIRAEFQPEVIGTAQQVGVTYNAHGMTIRRKHTSRSLSTHIIKIDNNKLDALKVTGRIRRIDGNHRLELAHQLQPTPHQPNNYKVPFCFILLGEPGNAADDYTESLVFHSINSTAKPLESEHALRLILGQPPGETMPPAREFAFNPNLYFTRLLHEKFALLPEPTRSRLGGRPISSLANAAKEMLHTYPDKKADLATLEAFANELVGALNELCVRLSVAQADLCCAEYFVELATHVWMQLPEAEYDEKLNKTYNYLEQMAAWLGHDGMRDLRNDEPLGRQLLRIFEEVRKRIPKKVFLARWYPKDSDGEQKTRAERRLQQLRHLIQNELNLELIDLGTKEGGTDLIHPLMYSAIGSSDIFIADLTGHRPNVMIELGYALKQHEKGRLLLYFEPSPGLDNPPFDVSSFRYERIAQAADIPDALQGHIQAILAEAAAGVI
jgi:hypothetical protein